MEKLVEVGILFDYYGSLLSERQRCMVDKYYNEDLSLNEIGDLYDISKQAVSENIKRAERRLYSFENKLHLKKRSERTTEFLKFIKEELKNSKTFEIEERETLLKKIDDFIKEDMGEL